MAYELDLWGGELHQRYLGRESFDDFAELCVRLQDAVDCGLLGNVIHGDFKPPPETTVERARQIIESISKNGL